MAARVARKLCQIYVGNVPWTVSKSELKDYFSKFGEIESVILAINKNTGMYKNYGFVQYVSETVADIVCSKKHILHGNTLKVQLSGK